MELVAIVLIICECCHNIQVDGSVLWEELKIKGHLLIVYLCRKPFNDIFDKWDRNHHRCDLSPIYKLGQIEALNAECLKQDMRRTIYNSCLMSF